MMNSKQRAKFIFETMTMPLEEKISRLTALVNNIEENGIYADVESRYLEKLWKLVEARAVKEIYG